MLEQFTKLLQYIRNILYRKLKINLGQAKSKKTLQELVNFKDNMYSKIHIYIYMYFLT